ncbi:hypothetical protein Gohar_008720, partial [Gossypium harknessii]|nr:hypothetical protein [Gossypium harknessii]
RGYVINGVKFCYDCLGNIRGYDVNERTWKELKGLSSFLCSATMANLGGKLMVIEVKTNEARELWGNIECLDVVLLVPREASIIHCLAVAFVKLNGKAW